MKRHQQILCPTEHQECLTFIDWSRRVFYQGEPLFERVVHVPNERDLHVVGAKKKLNYSAMIKISDLAAVGTRKGFPDYAILAPFADCGGLYLEAKRRRGGTVTQDQKDWRDRLIRFGYQAVICNGAEAMVAATHEYFESHAAPGEWINRVRFQ